MSEDEIKELVDTDISTDSFKKHNYYYFIIVLTKYAKKCLLCQATEQSA